MIKAINIKKSFGENVVLKGITTTFLAGKCNLIIGRSGAGKTVLLKSLVGLVKPEQGEIWFDKTN
ncbi:MAG TPA: ATP-binding cassette domain-containing protein, partial [Saprospiraceae bacterium]|nr:ATP-binding cassette domain-containing protein [Saprospiraceae bacterium]